MLKIYAIDKAPPLASSAGRCFLLLEELGLEYETVGLKFSEREHKSEEYLKLNPNGKIPTLIDDGFVLWESMAINRYLARKHRPELLGKSETDMALVEQWSVWGASEYQTPLLVALRHGMMLPPEKRDSGIFDSEVVKLNNFHKIIDRALEDKEYLVGDYITLADLQNAVAINFMKMINVDISNFSNLSKWLEKISNRPSFQKLQSQSKRPG